MISDLDFFELFRTARVREYMESLKTFDPLTTPLKDYVMKIQEKSFTQEDFNECINKGRGDIIKYMRQDSLYSEANLSEAVKKDGLLLGYIPARYQTETMCRFAVRQNGLALQHVADDYITNEICKIAVEQNPNAKVILVKIYNRYIEEKTSPSEASSTEA